MGIFKALIRTVVETPIALTKDVFTFGGISTENGKPYTQETYEDIMDELD